MTLPLSLHGAVPLSHWGVIRARGADAGSFLQGQLTNDVLQLGPDAARLAGYCTAKGRLLASFVVWKAADDEILLACHASVLASTLKQLSMFVLRAQCKLSDASAELPLVGVAGSPAEQLASDLAPWRTRPAAGGQLIRLPDAAGVTRVMLAGHGGPQTWPAIALDAWRWLEVQSGVPVIEAATAEQFVPQMLNFEVVGGVSFQKGCYPGQEVVARAQYRGAVKRRMFLFDTDDGAAPGQEVFASSDPGQPAGLVANAAPRPDGAGSSALVELKLGAVDAGSVHLGAPDGAMLQRRELPYALPVDAGQAA